MIFAIGNSPGNENGSLLVDVDQVGNVVPVYAPAEQGSCVEIISDGMNVIIPGIDPTESWLLGNIYLNDGSWSKIRTLPNVIHALGACFHNGKLFVAAGGHTGDLQTFRGYVLRSEDLGQSWSSVQVADYRAYSIVSFNNLLYVVGDEFLTPTLYWSDDDGDTWTELIDFYPQKKPRMVVWNNLLVIAELFGGYKTINNLGEITRYTPPPHYTVFTWNMLAVHDGYLYVLCTDRIYRTTDLVSWEYYCNLGRQCTGLSVWPGFGLIVSEIGSDARLLRIPLV